MTDQTPTRDDKITVANDTQRPFGPGREYDPRDEAQSFLAAVRAASNAAELVTFTATHGGRVAVNPAFVSATIEIPPSGVNLQGPGVPHNQPGPQAETEIIVHGRAIRVTEDFETVMADLFGDADFAEEPAPIE